MPKALSGGGGGWIVDGSDLKPWPEGPYLMVLRGVYPFVAPARKHDPPGFQNRVSKLVFDGLREDGDDGLACPTFLVSSWPGEPGFEYVRTKRFGGPDPAPAGEPFAGMVGTVCVATVEHKQGRKPKPGEEQKVFANIVKLNPLLTSAEIEDAAEGMSADEVAAAFDAQEYVEDDRDASRLESWRLQNDLDAEAEPAPEDPDEGAAPGARQPDAKTEG